MAPNFVKRKEEVHSLTHFLCMPIATTLSRAQLEQTLYQFRNDPSTSEIAPGAYRPLQTLHLPIKTLSLKTGDSVDAACQHLRSLNPDSLLRHLLKKSPRCTRGVCGEQQTTPSIYQGSSTDEFLANSKSPPLTFTLSGVRCTHLRGQGTLNWRLHALCTDSTSRLRPFLDEIRRSFDAAGFRIAPLRQTYKYGEHVVLLSTMSNRPNAIIRDTKQPDKFRQVYPPLFETQDIIKKFEDFVFAENIRLEKLSLCELGLQTALGKFGAETRLPEVCSVPLP